MRVRDHERVQAAGLELLRKRRIDELPEFVAYWDRGRDPAYVAAIEDSRRELTAMLLDLDRSLSGEQRALAVHKLRRYAADFRQLADRQ